MTLSSITATATAVLTMTPFTATSGELLDLFHYFFKHFLPLSILLKVCFLS